MGQLAKVESQYVTDMLSRIDEVKQLIRSGTVKEVLEVQSQAELLSKYVRSHDKNSLASVKLSEIAAIAAIRAGELLMEIDKVGHRPEKGSTVKPFSEHLADIGITKSRASRLQKLASLPRETRERHIETQLSKGKHVTLNSLYRLLPKKNGTTIQDVEQDGRVVASLSELEGETFATIYADPPWAYGNQATRAATDNHYDTMTVDDISAMPVKELAAANAQLHLWTTNGFLREAFTVIDSWGFTYKSCFVWCKPQFGIGNYWRVSHEFMLLGVRGSATFRDKALKSWCELPRGKHSAKPEAVREMVEKAWVGPRLELFGRVGVDGWTVMGNEVARTLYS